MSTGSRHRSPNTLSSALDYFTFWPTGAKGEDHNAESSAVALES